MREEARSRPAALDRARGKRCLVELFAAAAGHAWADDPVHDEPAGNVLQLFGDILADTLQLAAAILAGIAWLKNLLSPGKMIR